MRVPLLDLTREHAQIRDEIRRVWSESLAVMHLLQGEQVAAFEAEIAAYLGTPSACGVASGTDALVLAMLSLGIGTGDEVIMHANAFVAALEAVHFCGARPVLVDVEADGLGPDLEQVEHALTGRTKALVAVHLYGAPVRIDALLALARRHAVMLIEDASHAHGARRQGRRVGSFGDAGCFSTGVVKNLGAYGDAGFVTSTDPAVVARIRVLQAHGQERKNHHVWYGLNSRLDELQAAVLRIKLRSLDARNQRRRAIAAFYSDRFVGLDVAVPREHPGDVHVYHQYVIRTSRRDQLQQHLKTLEIETGIHYPVPLHRQLAWLRHYGESRALPRAEQQAREILSLPVFPDLTDAEVEWVADGVASFFR